MGRGCRGQALPRCSQVAASTPLWKDGCPAATTEGPEDEGLFGDIERGHLQEPGWDVAWLGQAQPRGASLAPPTSLSPAHPMRKEMGHAKRWPQGHCHSWAPCHHDLALAHGHSRVGLPPLIPPRRRKGPAPDLQISKSCSPHLQGEGGRW